MKKTTKTVDTKKAAVEVKEAVAEVKKAVEPAVKKAAKAAEPAVKKAAAEAKKAAEPAVKKAAETVAEVKKAAPKKTARKAAEPKVKFVLQYAGKDVTCKQMMDAAKSAWNGETMKEVVFYVKPEENRVYFVVNGEEAGSFEI